MSNIIKKIGHEHTAKAVFDNVDNEDNGFSIYPSTTRKKNGVTRVYRIFVIYVILNVLDSNGGRFFDHKGVFRSLSLRYQIGFSLSNFSRFNNLLVCDTILITIFH